MDSEGLFHINDKEWIQGLTMGTPAMLHLDGLELGLRSILIGLKPDHYVAIELPGMQGLANKLYPGNEAIVGFVNKGMASGFRSRVLGHIAQPYPVVFLSFPRLVVQHLLRGEKRVKCFLPARAQIRDKSVPATILNLSGSGAQLTCFNGQRKSIGRPRAGHKIVLTFKLEAPRPAREGKEERGEDSRPAPEGQSLTLTGEIRNVRGGHDFLAMGVEFEDTSEEVRDILNRYIQGFSEGEKI